MSWRSCNASLSFVAALNARYPSRDKGSDGTIGNAAHASRSSDHNPWIKVGSTGVVRARDVDKDGVDAAWIVEELRKLGAAGDPRLAGGGYIIFNRRITKGDFSGWAVYNGSNPHTKHFHISFSRNQAGFDSKAGWAFLGGSPGPTKAGEGVAAYEERNDAALGSRVLSLGSVGTDVGFVQRWHGLKDDDEFGPATDAAVRGTQARNGLTVDGEVGPVTWGLMGVGAAAPPALSPDPREHPRSFQQWYNAYPFSPALLPVIRPLADNWGPQSDDALRKVQSRYGLMADGIPGEVTRALLHRLGWR